MRLIIDNEIRVQGADASEAREIKSWLTIANPAWIQNEKMGFSNYKTPRNLFFYKEDGPELIVPSGLLNRFMNEFIIEYKDIRTLGEKLDFGSKIELYDYQEKVVADCIEKSIYEDVTCDYLSGVIVMPAGSGKTQTALELIARLGFRTLWLTHTNDLLNQSYQRAKDNLKSAGLGKIAAGKIKIGTHITFATVQTMSKLDLSEYKNKFDVIVVDEAHRISGSPMQLGMFYKVISSLSAKYKIGLTATPYRAAKGTEIAMFSLLGDVITEVEKSVVNTIKADIVRINTRWQMGLESFFSDGTINYSRMLTEMSESESRLAEICKLICENSDRAILVLSDRLELLRRIKDVLGEGVMIDGSMVSKKAKTDRENAIEDMRTGKERILYASYSLAKEGLDIPRLDCLILATPKKDKATVIQSVGRIERVFDGKKKPIVYDIVDDERLHQSMFNVRRRIYRFNGNEIID